MKLVYESFMHDMNTGVVWDDLANCLDDDTLYTTGVLQFEDDYSMQDRNLDYVIVPVWDKDNNWGYCFDDIKEYLIVDLKVLGPGNYANYSLEARVVKKVPKTEITIRQDDLDELDELCFTAVGIFKYKKLV